jgi:hypothetical protein
MNLIPINTLHDLGDGWIVLVADKWPDGHDMKLPASQKPDE